VASSTSIAQVDRDARPDVADLVVAELVVAELEVVQLAPASPARRGDDGGGEPALVAEARGGGDSPDVAQDRGAGGCGGGEISHVARHRRNRPGAAGPRW
jgi:hypothetical protein